MIKLCKTEKQIPLNDIIIILSWQQSLCPEGGKIEDFFKTLFQKESF